MKIIKTVFLVFFVTLIAISSVKAESGPPEPNMKSAKAAAGGPPPPDPRPTPIDTHIVFLLLAGMSLGITIVYKNKIKKASM